MGGRIMSFGWTFLCELPISGTIIQAMQTGIIIQGTVKETRVSSFVYIIDDCSFGKAELTTSAK